MKPIIEKLIEAIPSLLPYWGEVQVEIKTDEKKYAKTFKLKKWVRQLHHLKYTLRKDKAEILSCAFSTPKKFRLTCKLKETEQDSIVEIHFYKESVNNEKGEYVQQPQTLLYIRQDLNMLYASSDIFRFSQNISSLVLTFAIDLQDWLDVPHILQPPSLFKTMASLNNSQRKTFSHYTEIESPPHSYARLNILPTLQEIVECEFSLPYITRQQQKVAENVTAEVPAEMQGVQLTNERAVSYGEAPLTVELLTPSAVALNRQVIEFLKKHPLRNKKGEINRGIIGLAHTFAMRFSVTPTGQFNSSRYYLAMNHLLYPYLNEVDKQMVNKKRTSWQRRTQIYLSDQFSVNRSKKKNEISCS